MLFFIGKHSECLLVPLLIGKRFLLMAETKERFLEYGLVEWPEEVTRNRIAWTTTTTTTTNRQLDTSADIWNDLKYRRIFVTLSAPCGF